MPAAGNIDGAGAVKSEQLFIGFATVKLTPALVENAPHGDAWAVVQVADGTFHIKNKFFTPGGIAPPEKAVFVVAELCYADGGKRGFEHKVAHDAAADHVLPDEHTEPVTVVVPAQRLHFYVLTQHVEAKALHGGDVVNHRIVGGGSVESVGPITLVEHAAVEQRLSVEHEAHNAVLIRQNGEFAHGKIACYFVLAEGNFYIVEKWVIRRPRAHRALSIKFEHGFAMFIGHTIGDSFFVLEKCNPSGFGIFCCNFEQNRAAFEHRSDFYVLNIVFRHFLEPNGLPNSALGGVPDSAAFKNLLAVCVVRAVGKILHTKREHVLSLFEHGCNVRLKWQVAAAVLTDFFTVQINLAALVHRAEMKDNVRRRRALVLKNKTVVEIFVRQKLAHNTGEWGFRREGNEDFSVVIFRLIRKFCDGVIPVAVQVSPVFSNKLWAGILRQDVLRVEIFAPFGIENMIFHKAFLPYGNKKAAAKLQNLFCKSGS